MKHRTEIAVTVIIYACLSLAMGFGGVVGFVLATVWIGVGAYLAANSTSPGFWADVSFVATWPIYVWLERGQ